MFNCTKPYLPPIIQILKVLYVCFKINPKCWCTHVPQLRSYYFGTKTFILTIFTPYSLCVRDHVPSHPDPPNTIVYVQNKRQQFQTKLPFPISSITSPMSSFGWMVVGHIDHYSHSVLWLIIMEIRAELLIDQSRSIGRTGNQSHNEANSMAFVWSKILNNFRLGR